jgi:hypothetical protein
MLASLIRTLVPLLVAWAGPVLTGWLGWTPDDVSRVATLLVAGAYYLLVRLAERYVSPRAGWLLGRAGAPVYDPPTVVSQALSSDFDRIVSESRGDRRRFRA